MKEEKVDHVHTKQLLNHESIDRKMKKKHIKHDRAIIEKLINVLNKIQFFIEKNCELDFVNNVNLEILIFKMRNKKSKMRNLRNELKHTIEKLEIKTHFFENLSKKY